MKASWLLLGALLCPSLALADRYRNCPDHLPWPHFTQITAALAGRAGRVFLGQHIKRFALGDTLLELFGFFTGFHQDVTGLSFHVVTWQRSNVRARDYA